jgi:hypothetical protein
MATCARSSIAPVVPTILLNSNSLLTSNPIMSLPTDNERPLTARDNASPGWTGRAMYRYVRRKASRPAHNGVLFSRRVDNQKVIGSFVKDNKVIPCCANTCCAKLLGSHAELFSTCPCPEESNQRLEFVKAVVATRTHVHENGQTDSGKRLLARLRLGFSEGMRALPFAQSYSFPGQRGASQQEYWWRTEDGACVQVLSDLVEFCSSTNSDK